MLVGTIIAIGSAAVAVPVLAGESGLTCAEKYHAAMATGKLKRGVTKTVFMERCVAESRNEQTHRRKHRQG
jgi:hypothetical protein